MGQALDQDGKVLDEAFGDTKREVFDKLIERNPEAHEIRIKALKDKLMAEGPLPDPLLQFFTYSHLPERLQTVSQPFCELAHNIVLMLPRNAERTVALRKLLEAKDCAVRALLAV